MIVVHCPASWSIQGCRSNCISVKLSLQFHGRLTVTLYLRHIPTSPCYLYLDAMSDIINPFVLWSAQPESLLSLKHLFSLHYYYLAFSVSSVQNYIADIEHVPRHLILNHCLRASALRVQKGMGLVLNLDANLFVLETPHIHYQMFVNASYIYLWLF